MFLDSDRPRSTPPVAGDDSEAAVRLWQALRQRLAPQSVPSLRVQHLVLAESDVVPVRSALQAVGAELGLQLELDSRDGDVVLLDRDLALQLSSQLIAAFSEGRPCITVGRIGPGALSLQAVVRDLREQLLALPLVQLCFMQPRGDAPMPLPDSGFDTLWDIEPPVRLLPPEAQARVLREQHMLQLLARRHGDPQAAPLRVCYGPQAALQLDFAAGQAQADAAALQLLRLQRELPRLAPATEALQDSLALTLDQALWDLGVAAARLPLLHAPPGWWQVPLDAAEAAAAAAVHTRVPSYLELLRCLADGPISPAELRRRVRIGIVDLRRVLQPLLLLGKARWFQQPSPIHPGAPACKPVPSLTNPTAQPVSSC